MKSMKIYILSICALFILSSGLTAQSKLDSLWSVWEDESQADTVRLKAIKIYAWEGYLFTQADSAFYFAELQYNFAKERGLQKDMAKALNTLGASLYLRGRLNEAMEYYQQGLEIREAIGDKVGVGNSLNNIGNIYYSKGNYSKTIEYYNKSLKIEEELGDIKGVAGSLINIGNLYDKLGNSEEAIVYYTKSLKIEEELKNNRGIARALNSIG
ncbi:MAG: tetratricopeptide repeat protein, partial [Bacteroidales bacterium]|nr:tetratricopeptide repeat protein [Bacteroidales bacterium]